MNTNERVSDLGLAQLIEDAEYVGMTAVASALTELQASRAAIAVETKPVAWVKVYGFDYEVSDTGDVRSIASGKVLSKNLAGLGYVKAELWKDGKRKQTYVHRLVAEAFLPNPENKPEVNHKDGDKLNNAVSNLEWCTRSENEMHSRYVLNTLCKPIVATDLIDGSQRHFASTELAARELGCVATNIWRALNGQSSSFAGMTWQYASPQPLLDAPRVKALEGIEHAETMLSEHIERFHDYEEETPECASLRSIQHHLLGCMIGDDGEYLALQSDGEGK